MTNTFIITSPDMEEDSTSCLYLVVVSGNLTTGNQVILHSQTELGISIIHEKYEGVINYYLNSTIQEQLYGLKYTSISISKYKIFPEYQILTCLNQFNIEIKSPKPKKYLNGPKKDSEFLAKRGKHYVTY